MAAKPATNQKYLEFSEDGGYKGFGCGHCEGAGFDKEKIDRIENVEY